MGKIQINQLKTLFDIHNMMNNKHSFFKDQDEHEHFIDLSGLSFVSPIGAIALLTFFEEVINLKNYKLVLPKNSDKLVSYIERINFFNHCPVQIKRDFEEHYDIDKMSERTRQDSRKVLLEITKIEKHEDVDTVYDSIIYILRDHGMQSEQLTKVAAIVTELVTNILDHSETHGYAAVQYYPTFNKVMIGIADNGIGIINKINSSGETTTPPLKFVENAFTPNFSTIDPGRGYGLADARRYSYENTIKTSFQLRTQSGLYDIKQTEIIEIRNDLYCPGTYFLIEIEFKD